MERPQTTRPPGRGAEFLCAARTKSCTRVALAAQKADLDVQSVPASAEQSRVGLPGNHADAGLSWLPELALTWTNSRNSSAASHSASVSPSLLAADRWSCAGVVGFSHWQHESDFRPLYTGMAPEDAAAVVQKLKESGVEYRLADNGTTVLVPVGQIGRIAPRHWPAAGLPKTGRIGFELFDKTNFGATEFAEHMNYQRALEGELERSSWRWRKWSRRAFTSRCRRNRSFSMRSSRPKPA